MAQLDGARRVFARVVAEQATERGLRVMVVDGGRSIDENSGSVEAWFGLEGMDDADASGRPGSRSVHAPDNRPPSRRRPVE